MSKVMNVLILGGTGMGKSTMLNTMTLVTKFRTLEAAIRGNFFPPIPIKTLVSDDAGEEHTVTYGEDGNEAMEVGKSATQRCKKYEFVTPLGLFRILDTPGLADTEGVAVDHKHLSNILDAISELDEIHRIIFVLKANATRLSAEFKYCLNALLTRISKTAKNNIVFVFTNARTAFYGPGTTNALVDLVLKEIASKPPHVRIPLEKINKFSIDNECLSYIVGVKRGISFSEYQAESYQRSWDLAVVEFHRLFEYIFKCEEPHRVLDTVNVCNVRELIALLVRPLAEVSELIQDNILLIKDHEKVVQKASKSINDLISKLYTPHIESVVKELDHPRTICVSPSCCDVVNWGSIKKYRSKLPYCHAQCYLVGIQRECINNHDLLDCAAMNGTDHCHFCAGQCSYRTHMHIYYEIEDRHVQYKDPVIDGQIKTKGDAKVAAENKIRELEMRVKELKDEQGMIIKSTALFAEFLQRNPIAAYNYAFEDYLKHLIESKKTIDDGTGSSVKEMEDVLKSHLVERKIFEDTALNGGGHEFTAEEVLRTIKNLFDLKHYGERIKGAVEQHKKARTSETSIKKPVTLDRLTVDNGFFRRIMNDCPRK